MADIPSKKHLEKIIKILQAIMEVRDWEIEIDLVTGKEMIDRYPNEATYGTCGMSDRNVRRNWALISINKEETDDWYNTLVHEMIHVQETIYVHATDAYMNEHGSYLEDIHEGYVDRLTRMFVKLYPYNKLLNDNHKIFKEN